MEILPDLRKEKAQVIKRTQRIKRKSSSKNKEVKQLMERAEGLMKQVCFARDGKRCMVEKHRPDIEIIHGEVIQADHCISRGVKALYYNPRNLTACCNICNWLKSIDSQGVRRAIDEIVIKREGQEWFDGAKKILQGKDKELLQEIFADFKDCGTVEHVHKQAMSEV